MAKIIRFIVTAYIIFQVREILGKHKVTIDFRNNIICIMFPKPNEMLSFLL